MSQTASPATAQEELILVLDFGGQTAQLIARRVREQHVFCQLVRHNLSASRIRELNPKGIILSGSPASVYSEGSPHPDPAIFELGIPILGICYGMQASCLYLGSKVLPGDSREFGRTPCKVQQRSELFDGVPDDFSVWMSHGDQVQDLSEHFYSLAATETCPFAAVKHHTRPLFGLQFHPEVTHTEFGGKLLSNFVKNVCGCQGTWKISSFIEREISLANASAKIASSVVCQEASIHPSLRHYCTGRLDRNCRASLLTMGCSETAKRKGYASGLANTSRLICTWSMPDNCF